MKPTSSSVSTAHRSAERTIANSVGRFGVWSGLDGMPLDAAIDFVRGVEAAGYSSFWTREGFGRDPFALLAVLSQHTSQLTLGTSIANIYARDAVGMRDATATLQEFSGGRFVLGLGVSHLPWVEGMRGHEYGRPVEAMRAFLERYRSAPPYRGPATPAAPILVGALGPGMVDLAAAASDGAMPYLITAPAVATMRSRLDGVAASAGRPRPLLAVVQAVLLETNPERARTAGRSYLAPYLGLPAYRASFERLGFAASDLEAAGSNRLVDELIAWGTADQVRAWLSAVLDLGADHVAIIPLSATGTAGDLTVVKRLAPGVHRVG